MRIASTIPFKAALAAASIVTIGVIAVAMFDTSEVVVQDHCELRKREVPHPRPPIEPGPSQPLPVTST